MITVLGLTCDLWAKFLLLGGLCDDENYAILPIKHHAYTQLRGPKNRIEAVKAKTYGIYMTQETTTEKQNPSLKELIEEFAKKCKLSVNESQKLAISLLSPQNLEKYLEELAASKDIPIGDIATLCAGLGILSNKLDKGAKELSKISSDPSPDTYVPPEFDEILSEIKIRGGLESIRRIHASTGKQGGDFVIEGPDADTQENKKVHLDIKLLKAPEVAREQEIENVFNRPEAISLASAMRRDQGFTNWMSFTSLGVHSPSYILSYTDYIFHDQLVFHKARHNDHTRFSHYFIEYLRAGKDCSDGVCINPETFFTEWLPSEFDNRFNWSEQLKTKQKTEEYHGNYDYGDGSHLVDALIEKTKDIFIKFHDFNSACLSHLYSNHGRDKTSNLDFLYFRDPHFHFDIAPAKCGSFGKLTEFRGLFSNEIRSRCEIHEFNWITKAIAESIVQDEYRGVFQTSFEKINAKISEYIEDMIQEQIDADEERVVFPEVPKEHQVRMALRFLSHTNLLENKGKYYELIDSDDSATFLAKANMSLQEFRKPHFKHDAESRLVAPSDDDVPSF